MLSELQAVNTMLSAIGSAPVNSISGQVSADVAMAKNILEEIRQDVLLQGWNFNTMTEVEVSPETDGRIPIENTVLRVDLSDSNPYTTVNPVQRGGYLYDRKSASYTFTEDLKLDYILDLAWDELPLVARRYITAKATRVMLSRTDGDQVKMRSATSDELEALGRLNRHELDTGDYTIFDNETAQLIVRRGI